MLVLAALGRLCGLRKVLPPTETTIRKDEQAPGREGDAKQSTLVAKDGVPFRAQEHPTPPHGGMAAPTLESAGAAGETPK